MTTIVELAVAAAPAAWRTVGFSVDDDGLAQVGTVRLRFTSDDSGGVVHWILAGVPDEDIADVDGLATSIGEPSPLEPANRHPNGATAIDHVVVMTPDLTRTTAAVERRLGLPVRRVRDAGSPERPLQQAFFRLGEVVLEVVGPPSAGDAPGDGPVGPARFYGLAFTVASLEHAVALLGPELVSPIRPAVQPGRSIATIRAAGLHVPVALMSA